MVRVKKKKILGPWGRDRWKKSSKEQETDIIIMFKDFIRILNGCEFSHEGNCSASRGLPSDAEQLSRVTEFSCTEYALFYQFLR